VKLRRSFAIILSLALVLGAVSSVVAQEIERRPVEDPMFGLSSVVPTDWQELGGGQYVRSTDPDDHAGMAIQSAAASVEDLWSSLLPTFALPEPPEATFEYYTDLFDWTVYEFSVELGEQTLAFGLALAEKDGTTNLVLVQSDPEDYDILREQVLKPAIDAFAPLAPAPTPHPSTFDYQIEEVAFPGGSEGVDLAGTLTLPNGPGPHPVVVTMSGSGAQDRDESLKPITALKPFAVIADALTSAGVGVLRYDDRGVGGSTGDYNAATIAELAEDARAAIDYLETRDDIDPDRIGLFGHSEGGLYSAILGSSDPRVAFIAMMAPAVIDGITLIVEQNMALTRSAGNPEEMVEAFGEYSALAMPMALDGDFEGLEQATRDLYGRLWDESTAEDQVIAGDRDTFVQFRTEQVMPVYTSDWYRSLLGYDPTADWEQVSVPVLGVFAGKDVQVIAESNEAALRAALDTAGNTDVETVTIADANHLFQAADTGAYAEYMALEPEFIDGFVGTVVDWITIRAGVAE
jgi:hypothetical protein